MILSFISCIFLLYSIQVYSNQFSIKKDISTKNFRELWILNSPKSIDYVEGLTLLKDRDDLLCMIKASVGVFSECSSGWNGVIINDPFNAPRAVAVIELDESQLNYESLTSSRFIFENSNKVADIVKNFNSNKYNSLLITDDNSKVTDSKNYLLQNLADFSLKYNNTSISLKDARKKVVVSAESHAPADEKNRKEFNEIMFQTFNDLLSSMKLDKNLLKLLYFDLKFGEHESSIEAMSKIQGDFLTNIIIPHLIKAYSGNIVIMVSLKSKFSYKTLIDYQIKTASVGLCSFDDNKIQCTTNSNEELKNNLCSLFYADYPTIFEKGDCRQKVKRASYLVQRQNSVKNPHKLYTWAEFDDNWASIFNMCLIAVIMIIFFVVGAILAITNIDPTVYSILYRETPSKLKFE